MTNTEQKTFFDDCDVCGTHFDLRQGTCNSCQRSIPENDIEQILRDRITHFEKRGEHQLADDIRDWLTKSRKEKRTGKTEGKHTPISTILRLLYARGGTSSVLHSVDFWERVGKYAGMMLLGSTGFFTGYVFGAPLYYLFPALVVLPMYVIGRSAVNSNLFSKKQVRHSLRIALILLGLMGGISIQQLGTVFLFQNVLAAGFAAAGAVIAYRHGNRAGRRYYLKRGVFPCTIYLGLLGALSAVFLWIGLVRLYLPFSLDATFRNMTLVSGGVFVLTVVSFLSMLLYSSSFRTSS